MPCGEGPNQKIYLEKNILNIKNINSKKKSNDNKRKYIDIEIIF